MKSVSKFCDPNKSQCASYRRRLARIYETFDLSLVLLRVWFRTGSVLLLWITWTHSLGGDYCEVEKLPNPDDLHDSSAWPHIMTARPAPTFSPPPLLHTRSSPSVNQQFPSLRPPLQTTPTRDGRSRSTNHVNGSSIPSKPESMSYDNFYDVLSQRYSPPQSCSSQNRRSIIQWSTFTVKQDHYILVATAFDIGFICEAVYGSRLWTEGITENDSWGKRHPGTGISWTIEHCDTRNCGTEQDDGEYWETSGCSTLKVSRGEWFGTPKSCQSS